MKLRNKKTGEIAEPFGITCINGRTFVQFDDGKGTFKFEARSLSELNSEWEDVPEEPEEYWFIDYDGGIIPFSRMKETATDRMMKQIGNYFDTREEAEKAVEKLKAWKRLKDKGFKFTGFAHKDRGRLDELEIYCQLGECPEDIEDMEDVCLLFGDEK